MDSRFYVDPDISRARTLNTEFYTDPAIFESAKEIIFANTWQFAGSTQFLKNPGDIHPFTLLENYLDEALSLSKDKEGNTHLLSNVCTHRGNIVTEQPCNRNELRCRYHGRRFGLDGKFISMPEFQGVQDFPCPDDSLKQLPLYRWGQWLFTSLNQKFDPELFFRDMAAYVAWMPMDKFLYRPEMDKEYIVDAHWALYCENYLEGFHIPFVHAGLNEVISFGDYATELFYPYSILQKGIGKNPKECFDLPESSPDFGQQVAAYYFWVFPNMMFNFYPWGLSVNIVQPLSLSQTKVRYLSFVWDESRMKQGAGSALDRVEQEDSEIVRNVQKGIRSRFYTLGRYSVTREQGTHHFHRILAEFMAQI